MDVSPKASSATIDYQLLSHIAHDARGPFNGLVGFSELLDSDFTSLSEERRQEYTHLLKVLASKSFLQLQTVIAWIKLISNNFTLNTSTFSSQEVLHQALSYNAHDIENKSISVNISDEPTLVIRGDAHYMPIALGNLIAFSLRFIEAKSQILFATDKSSKSKNVITIQFQLAASYEKANLQQLLALNPTNLTEEDTGLWVCGHIMERHNAKIDLNMSSTNLTRITVTFP
jgi:K+-sensing histidine kinase KdpD